MSPSVTRLGSISPFGLLSVKIPILKLKTPTVRLDWAEFYLLGYFRQKFIFKNFSQSQTVLLDWEEFPLWATVSQNTDNTTLISLTKCDQMGQNYVGNKYYNWYLTVWPDFMNFLHLGFSQTKFWYQNFFILVFRLGWISPFGLLSGDNLGFF